MFLLTEQFKPELLVSEMPRCPLHDSTPNSVLHGWAEPEPSQELPLVFSTLHQISLHTHCLLQSHGGSIPLARLEELIGNSILILHIQLNKLYSINFLKRGSMLRIRDWGTENKRRKRSNLGTFDFMCQRCWYNFRSRSQTIAVVRQK